MVSLVNVLFFSPDNSRASVTIRSDHPELPGQIEELTGAAARNFILTQAIASGLKGIPGIASSPRGPYPLNSANEIIETLKDENGNMLPATSPRMQPAYYQVAYEVQGR